jgi:hypothetical protein
MKSRKRQSWLKDPILGQMIEGDQSVVILNPRIGAGVNQELGQIDVAVKKASMQGGVTRFLKNEKKRRFISNKIFLYLANFKNLKML